MMQSVMGVKGIWHPYHLVESIQNSMMIQ